VHAINRLTAVPSSLTHWVVSRGSPPRERSTGGRPVTSSTRRTPKEYMSLLSVSWYVLRYSGSTYPAAPFTGVASDPAEPEPDAATPAGPKPATFAVRASVRNTPDERTAPWMIGCSADHQQVASEIRAGVLSVPSSTTRKFDLWRWVKSSSHLCSRAGK
jgi:hypothetical protein